MWWPGDCQKAPLWNRDCPWVVHGDGRFYSKCCLLRGVTSVATEQTTRFLAWYKSCASVGSRICACAHVSVHY